ncbi:MAG: hypothetical protein KDD69_13550 [Bdellovibrionales bacterium]|nr:hypothetical protein [Bdellovibrionales bacterium]
MNTEAFETLRLAVQSGTEFSDELLGKTRQLFTFRRDAFGSIQCKESVAALNAAAEQLEPHFGNREGALSFVLAGANVALVSEVLDSLIASSKPTEVSANATTPATGPRQSSLFRILLLEGDAEAVAALLLETIRFLEGGTGGRAAAEPRSFCALLASQELLGALLQANCVLECSEPFSFRTAASRKSAGQESSLALELSLALRVNRELGQDVLLSVTASEQVAQGLGLK